jgi:hypothetical protein
MKPTAYSYKRWSSTIQGKSHTEERQAELAEAYCHRHGLTPDTKRKVSDKGVSGYSGKNVRDGALGAFIKAIEAGEIEPGSFLLVENVDRLSRLPIMEALTVFQRIIGAGIVVVTLRDEQQYSMERLKGDWTKIFPVLFSMGRGHDDLPRQNWTTSVMSFGPTFSLEKEFGHETETVPSGTDCLDSQAGETRQGGERHRASAGHFGADVLSLEEAVCGDASGRGA